MDDIKDKTEYLSKKYHSRYEKSVYVDKTWTIPNILTFSRLVALPVLVYTLFHLDRLGPIPTIAIGGYMFVSDLLDGVLAKAMGQISIVGAIADPVIDKVVIDTLAVTFAIIGWLPVWAVSLIILRDLGIVAFGVKIYLRYGTLVTPVFLGRITPLAWGAVFITAFAYMDVLKWTFLSIAMVLTVVSGYLYYSRYSELIAKNERDIE